MEEIIKNLTGLALIANLIGMIFLVYQHFRKPDENASDRLNVIEKTCPIKHKVIDDALVTFTKSLELIKDNHLRHIEGDIAGINEKMATLAGQVNIMIELFKDQAKK